MAATFAVDTNCMVAAVCGWHEQHRQAAAEIERRLAAGERMAVAVHALTEAYSVLTRLPAPHRLAPADAWAVLDGSFGQTGTVTTLSARQHVGLLAGLAGRGVGGGRVHDALIAACAVKAGATTLLTFNAKHFDAARELDVVVPDSEWSRA